jgi:hypothetical protein
MQAKPRGQTLGLDALLQKALHVELWALFLPGQFDHRPIPQQQEGEEQYEWIQQWEKS